MPLRIQDEDQLTHEGATIAADEHGNVAIVWLDPRISSHAGPEAHAGHGHGHTSSLPLVLARSRDNGVTFSANHVVESSYPGDACVCCAPDAAWRNERLLIAFRGAHENIRDIHLLEQVTSPSSFRDVSVADQEWELAGCPADGPRLTVSETGLNVAWMSEGEVYHASSDGQGQFDGARTPHASTEEHRGFPFTLENTQGSHLLAWTEGSTLRWELVDLAGAVTQGVGGELAAGYRPTGYVDGRGRFVLVF
jgi:hypothetical protein